MKIIRGIEVARVVIPPAHIRARSGQARTLSKRFQQRVFIQAEKQFVVVLKLCSEESLEELNLRIFEQRKRGYDSRGRPPRRRRPRRHGAKRDGASGGGCG